MVSFNFIDINCACNIASVVDNCLPSVVDTIASLICVYIYVHHTTCAFPLSVTAC